MEALRSATLADLMLRKRCVYIILASPVKSSSDEINRLCALVELDAINLEIATRPILA